MIDKKHCRSYFIGSGLISCMLLSCTSGLTADHRGEGTSNDVKDEILSAAAGDRTTSERASPVSRIDNANEFPVPSPPFSKGVFPCSTCHSALPDNFVRRKLKKDHTQIELKHGSLERWCFDCHIQHNRDKLRLSSGSTVLFSESYKLCGQCHGPKLRDWRVGVHGKRTGYWLGAKQYLLCAHCHDPHQPRFKKVKPEPPPHRPRVAQLENIGDHTH